MKLFQITLAASLFGLLQQGTAGQTPEDWYRSGRLAVEAARERPARTGRAKNVILFVGDGMGVTTVTAARILEGQLRGKQGEENLLSFEQLPYTALVKTYNTNQQTPDSAGTMTAMVTGVKTKAGVLSVDDRVTVGDAASAEGRELRTILELAEEAGLATGVVTTTRVTHATPAACYAHTPHRDWESDADLSDSARAAGFADIARQLLEFPTGNGLEVVLGGGRREFLPRELKDPEEPDETGRRKDGRNLTEEWLRKPRSAYVWNRSQFEQIAAEKVDHLLGLFDPSHMEYESDRASDRAGEPSLSEMTAKAIEILSRRDRGYFLMVEGGRIDHAHHAANAYRALTDTIEFSNAVRVAMEKTDRNDTLLVVTADHSHVFTMAGYPTRGNPILGKVVENQNDGTPNTVPAKDATGLPFTTLGYANGPGYAGPSEEQPRGVKRYPHRAKGFSSNRSGRPDLNEVDTAKPDHLQECMVPLASETHGGEDVPLYADGPQAHLFHGVIEQHVVFHVMVEALGLRK